MSKEHPRGVFRFGRRLLLRGAAGAAVSLPLLETFLPKRAKPEDMVHRFAVFVRQGNGCQQGLDTEPDRFWPTKLGALTTAGMQADGDQAVNVLSAYASRLLLVRGVEMKQLADAGCGHSQGGLLCLTASRTDGKNVEKALAMGESIDNRLARELGGAGVEPLTLRAGPRSSYLDDVLSYRAAGDRRVAESNPYNAYKALFGLPDQNAAEQARTATRRKSVNDLVRAEMTTLLGNQRLSSDDRHRLEAHSQAIRDLEVGMQCSLAPELLSPISAFTTKQAESDTDVLTAAKFQAQVIALAVLCGKTPAATLQIGNGNDQTQYTVDGTKLERFHHISHRINSDGSDGTPIANADVKHHMIDKLFAGIFRDLLDALASHTTPSGNLLDDGVAVWLNDLSNGPPHSTSNMPYVCAGSCGGQLKNGAYVDAADVSKNKFLTHNKFLNTIGAAVGLKNAAGGPLDDFGDAALEKGRIQAMLSA
ncbi:MAG: DUF1552 domain-containing protein [Myxococcales bacterium]